MRAPPLSLGASAVRIVPGFNASRACASAWRRSTVAGGASMAMPSRLPGAASARSFAPGWSGENWLAPLAVADNGFRRLAIDIRVGKVVHQARIPLLVVGRIYRPSRAGWQRR